jgi:hypothetical protein
VKRSPLKPSSKPLRRLSKKKAKSRAAFKLAVCRRDMGECVLCRYEGQGRVPANDIHHHLPVGRGGKDIPENGFMVCRFHHILIHTQPKQAHLNGWLLEAGEEPNEAARKILEFMEGR